MIHKTKMKTLSSKKKQKSPQKSTAGCKIHQKLPKQTSYKSNNPPIVLAKFPETAHMIIYYFSRFKGPPMLAKQSTIYMKSSKP